MATTLNDCFAEHHKLLPAEEALARLRASVTPVVGCEEVSLANAKGRILAQNLVSQSNVPPFNNAAVDGYAFNSQDLSANIDTTLPITAYIAAGGETPDPLQAGSAARIFTGAPLPAGADTVIMQEDVTADELKVSIPQHTKTGINWRPAGEDMSAGETVLLAGHRLRPQDIGCAAAMGYAKLGVFKRLKVAVFSSGNEIYEPGQTPPEGGIFDVNRYMLMTQVRQTGAEVSDLGILPDTLDDTVAALDQAAQNHDLILSSGGVSTGDKDHIAHAINQLGQIHFWRLAIKPGRPLAFGHIADTALIGFPGNPVATGVCFMRFGFPLLCALSGQTWPEPVKLTLPAAFSLSKKAGRTEWLRANLQVDKSGHSRVDKHPRQGSGILTSLVGADGLVELSESTTRIEIGDAVSFLPFSQFNVA